MKFTPYVALLLSCCVGRAGRGHPLHGEHPLPPANQVAQLRGYVAAVDEVDVTKHAAGVELRPGCHLVQTPTHFGHPEGNQGVAVVTTGEHWFALPMKAGHSYTIEVIVPTLVSPDGSASLRARERNAQGERVAEFAPVSSQEEIQQCVAIAAAR